jgi:DNA-binding FrmR family transcriptional regulator
MANYVWLAMTTLLSALVGSFLGSYLKKKGENLATQEDINKIVGQMAAVTESTKKIEAKISNEMWDRHKQWEFKKEALIEAMRALADIVHGLQRLDATSGAAPASDDEESGYKAELRRIAIEHWREVLPSSERARLVAKLVCGTEVNDRFSAVNNVTRDVAEQLLAGNLKAYDDSRSILAEAFTSLISAIRKELHISEPPES